MMLLRAGSCRLIQQFGLDLRSGAEKQQTLCLRERAEDNIFLVHERAVTGGDLPITTLESWGIGARRRANASRKPSGSEIQMNMTHEVRTSSAKNTDIRSSWLWLQKRYRPGRCESSGLPADLQLGPINPAS